MKRFSLFLALLAAPQLVYAQPDVKPQYDPKTQAIVDAITVAGKEDNLRAVAMMGAFYNSVQNAKTGRGHFVISKTTFSKDGKIKAQNIMDCTSTWRADSEGNTVKSVSEGFYTVTEDDQIKVERFYITSVAGLAG